MLHNFFSLTTIIFAFCVSALVAWPFYHVKIKVESVVKKDFKIRAGCNHKIGESDSFAYLSILKPDKDVQGENYALTMDGLAIVPIEKMHFEICKTKAQDGHIKISVTEFKFGQPYAQVETKTTYVPVSEVGNILTKNIADENNLTLKWDLELTMDPTIHWKYLL